MNLETSNYSILKSGVILKNGEPLAQYKNTQGYMYVTFNNKRTRVHTLIAEAYCFKPNNKKKLIVNHIDEDKTNNHYKNLEWVTYSDNTRKSTNHKTPTTIAREIAVLKEDDSIDFIIKSARDASRILERDISAVVRCCQGEWKRCAGKKLRYLDEVEGLNNDR